MPRPLLILTTTLVTLGLAVWLSGCTGGSKRSTALSGDSVPPVVAEETPVAAEESGIPGLTSAEVEAQPEVPALPGRIGIESTQQDVDAEAQRQAEYEERRKQLGDLSVDKRALYLSYVWGQELRGMQRDQPSDIPGLTIGEVEDQPAVPPLPELFDLRHSEDDLSRHAFVVASEEQAVGGLAATLSIEARQTYLTWAWSPLLAQRQARYQAALDERAARNAYRAEDAQREADWEHKRAEHRKETQRLIMLERHKVIPVLSEQEQAELRSITD